MKTKTHVFALTLVLALSITLSATTRHVGTGQQYSALTQATSVAVPGDTIMVHAGTYGGGSNMSNLQGSDTKWIYVMAAPGETVIYSGGAQAWHMTDARYVHIQGLVFEKQTSNGVNIDDGGSYSTPSRYVIFKNCTFRNINGTGNNDLLKMSGVDNFEIRNCTFLNGAAGGAAIDMVGCHNGLIINCHFENHGAKTLQVKGGSENVRIEANFFKNGGQRSINIGGSTGLQYFRPIDAKYEAANVKVYANVFIGSDAPIAFVGCINSEVVNNTMYLPGQYVLRILQEKVDPARFYPCGNNTFRNNIIYRDNQVSNDCNVGSNTDPQSFTFSNNLWYHAQNTGWGGPNLPVQDVNRIVGQNPKFVNAAAQNFALQLGSPAIAMGYAVDLPVQDYTGNIFYSPRSIGAFEGNVSTGREDVSLLPENKIMVYPNPSADGEFSVFGLSLPVDIRIYNTVGEELFNQQLTTNNYQLNLPHGIYILEVLTEKERWVQKLIIQQP